VSIEDYRAPPKRIKVQSEAGPFEGTNQVPFFFEDKARYPGFFGATGTGKTEIGSLKGVRFAHETGAPGLVAAPTFGLLTSTTLLAYIANSRQISAGPYNHSRRVLPIFDKNGKIVPIYFASLDVPRFNFGKNVGWVHIDEVWLQEVTEEAFGIMDMRARLPCSRPNQVFATGTPKPGHWAADFWGSAEGDLALETPWWGMTIYENPALDKKTIHILEQKYGGSDFGRQELLGEWIAEYEGVLFRWDWFQRYDSLPSNLRLVSSWDTALTTRDWSSYTVGQVWGMAGDQYYLVDFNKAKMEYAQVKQSIKAVAHQYGLWASIIEDRSSGQPAIQELRADHMRVVAFKPGAADKHDRVRQASDAVVCGRVLIPSDQYAKEHGIKWLPTLKKDVTGVPFDEKAWDTVDAMTQFILWAEERRASFHPIRRLPVRTTIGRTPVEPAPIPGLKGFEREAWSEEGVMV